MTFGLVEEMETCALVGEAMTGVETMETVTGVSEGGETESRCVHRQEVLPFS